MSQQLTKRSPVARRSWTQRLLKTFGMSSPSAPKRVVVRDEAVEPTQEDVAGIARQLIADDRYAFVLLEEAAEDVDLDNAQRAWKALQSQMALVPTGIIPAVSCTGARNLIEIQAFYLDRYAVTNKQYQRFVVDNGYENLEIWPREVWPSLMKFTDRTRRPGPRDWANGVYPSGRADHPVTGISWHEAAAYSYWVGKRLPSADEWQKAGGWPEQRHGSTSNRFPWGPIYEPERANLWPSKRGQTAAVNEYPAGATPNGIHQMSGNVWEWLADLLESIPNRPGMIFDPNRPLRRIVGGAFDTFIPAEASCHFITGQGELDRRENLGFRCALSANKIRHFNI